MELIVTHDSTDFDALAAAVAAQKVYEGATIAVGGLFDASVRDFLALHRDHFQLVRLTDVDVGAVERVIVVDVRRKSRLRHLGPLRDRIEAGDVEVHVYDHHGAADDDVAAALEVVEPVGSATTLLVERIRELGKTIDAVEATLFALGIHVDTGSLTYARTSPRDAGALAWVLGQGARLDVIGRYLRPTMSSAQRHALTTLMAAVDVVRIEKLDIGIARANLDDVVEGLAEVTNEASELLGHDAFFGLFRVAEDRIQVIGRARSPLVDVGAALKRLGGGGHPSAASAVVRSGALGEVRRRLEAVLPDHVSPPHAVRDLMSSPVRTVAPTVTLSELRDSLAEWRHTGVPVKKGERIVGIVSRRDVERAARAGRLHLPVGGYMSQHVVTTTPEAPLERALELMTEHDVGRLPVLEGERLVGIVTRSDVLNVLYDG